ncbi:MAG: 5'-nucleotidase [Patescibacteria group bacterium]|nr:5'-nucleotidase [Patescibacteria group bacterium]
MKKAKKFEKLIIAIASSALFDLSDSDKVFKEKGAVAYRKFQNKNLDKILKEGIAFPFIKRILKLNSVFKKEVPSGVVEVVLLSRNSHETGLRVFKSIQHYKLDIQKAGFFSGESPYRYIEAFNASLFLSANFQDVKLAVDGGYPAGMVLRDETDRIVGDEEKELRIAFDFDGVLADDESEKIYRGKGLKKYQKSEIKKSYKPLKPGPLQDFAKKIVELRKLESLKLEGSKRYKRAIKIILVTARSAPAHERAIHTLESWGIDIDQSFFLGTTKKKNILETLNPHIYFDDQKKNINGVNNVPSVFVPFGDTN